MRVTGFSACNDSRSPKTPWSVEIYLTRDGARVPLVFNSLENAGEKIIYASTRNPKPQYLDDRSLLCSAASLL